MAEKNPAISVIIAMYNSEKYVAECLESLLNQTFQDFEVIVVDDCSTDFSRAVVYSFFSKFNDRLKLAKLGKNSGFPGIPRNFALDAARGKYVYFLDSDDFLTETALEELYNVAEEFNAEVVHVEQCFTFFDEDGKDESVTTTIEIGDFVTEPTLETFDIGERVEAFTKRRYLWWACNKLFLRQLLVDNEIKFTPIKVWEDMIFAFMCIVTAKNYVRVPFISYYYRIRKNSLSHEARDVIDASKTAFDVFRALDDFMDTQEFFKENYKYRYDVLNFFMQERLEKISENLFVTGDLDPIEVFKFFKEKFFNVNPKNHVALTAYLFVTANLLKVYSKQQEAEIKELRTQVEEFKKIILEVVH